MEHSLAVNSWMSKIYFFIVLILQLLIGDFSLSYEQSKTQFAIWAILAAVSDAVCLV